MESKSAYSYLHSIFADIGSGQFYPQLRVSCNLLFRQITAVGGKTIELRGGIIEIHIRLCIEIIGRCYLF